MTDRTELLADLTCPYCGTEGTTLLNAAEATTQCRECGQTAPVLVDGGETE